MTTSPVSRSRATSLGAPAANRLLAMAVDNVQRDYPVHWTHFIGSADDLVPQRTLHPAFAGSYDWHSCVHQTWLMVRLLRMCPDLPDAGRARQALSEQLTSENCRTEAQFFVGDGPAWERPYGWAWLLLLDAELAVAGKKPAISREGTAGNSGLFPARELREALAPLTEVLRDRWIGWISGARLPMRVGTHGNTAFATALVLDAARARGDTELVRACEDAALRWYARDTGYGGFEPDAADFLSPALVEADLLRRVLPTEEFTTWFEGFLPDLDTVRWAGLREPVEVTDPTDPHGSHLSGLALSRAWCWRSLAEALPDGHRFAPLAEEAADAHERAGWEYVFGYGYAAEHWLGTFAAYLRLGALSG